jgi:hypothetical protein
MATEKILTDIPEEDVDAVEESFRSEGCNPVTKVRQENGKWTVIAICPDE